MDEQGPEAYRWASWDHGADTVLGCALDALSRLGGPGSTATVQVALLGRDGTRRVVAQHAVHTERADGGRHVGGALLRKALLRLESPFEGSIEVRWERGGHHQAEVVHVRVGHEPLGALDLWRKLAQEYRSANRRQADAMLDMFGASSSVIRAAGDVGHAMAGEHHGDPVPEAHASLSELLRHAEAAGVHDFVRRFLDAAGQAERIHPPAPEPEDSADDDPFPSEAGFDAWRLVGIELRGEE